MKPFPKLVGILAAVAAIILAAEPAALTALLGAASANVLLAVCAVVITFSHSITGTGPMLSVKK